MSMSGIGPQGQMHATVGFDVLGGGGGMAGVDGGQPSGAAVQGEVKIKNVLKYKLWQM